MNINGLKSWGKDLKGCTPNMTSWERGQRDLALPIMFALLDEIALCEMKINELLFS